RVQRPWRGRVTHRERSRRGALPVQTPSRARGPGREPHRSARGRGRGRVRQVVRVPARDAREPAAADGGRPGLTFSLGGTEPAVEARLRKLDGGRFAERLWAHDDSLWGDDPERRRVAANRLGWLDVPSSMRNEVDALHTLAISIWREGFTHAV